MNREDIIRMAREAGLDPDLWNYTDAFERFAALVASAERDKHKWDIHSCSPTCNRYACVATREAVLAEREACADIADQWAIGYPHPSEVIADWIRKRGQE